MAAIPLITLISCKHGSIDMLCLCVFVFTLAGDAVLARGEENEQGKLGADEALAGAWCAWHDQVCHGVGRGVNTPQAAAATAAAATRPTCTSLQPNTHPKKKNETKCFHVIIFYFIYITAVYIEYILPGFFYV